MQRPIRVYVLVIFLSGYSHTMSEYFDDYFQSHIRIDLFTVTDAV